MQLTSSAFDHERAIPARYTCDGENINPSLTFSEVPAGTKSLVLICDDPDAPAGTWVHWTLWNIDPATKEIKGDSVPNGAREGVTSFGHPGYGGPCPPRVAAAPHGEAGPPSGVHRYYFKLYALDAPLDLDENAKRDKLEELMRGHILDEAELMGTYERQR